MPTLEQLMQHIASSTRPTPPINQHAFDNSIHKMVPSTILKGADSFMAWSTGFLGALTGTDAIKILNLPIPDVATPAYLKLNAAAFQHLRISIDSTHKQSVLHIPFVKDAYAKLCRPYTSLATGRIITLEI